MSESCAQADTVTWTVLHGCQNRQIGRPYRDAQDRLLWKDKTRPRTYLAHHELEGVAIIIYVIIITTITIVIIKLIQWHELLQGLGLIKPAVQETTVAQQGQQTSSLATATA